MSDFRIAPPAGFEPGLRPAGGAGAVPGGEPAALDFGDLVRRSLDSVNESQRSANALAERFELGDPGVDLVRVMVEMQKARVSFEAISQVRNKFVEAYREIMNMQV